MLRYNIYSSLLSLYIIFRFGNKASQKKYNTSYSSSSSSSSSSIRLLRKSATTTLLLLIWYHNELLDLNRFLMVSLLYCKTVSNFEENYRMSPLTCLSLLTSSYLIMQRDLMKSKHHVSCCGKKVLEPSRLVAPCHLQIFDSFDFDE